MEDSGYIFWHYPRTDFAEFILRGMKDGLLERVSLFAPRKRGKTVFIQRDIIPLCLKRNILPVYIDFWGNEDSPEKAFASGVEKACREHMSFFHRVTSNISITPKVDMVNMKATADITKKHGQELQESFAMLEKCDRPILLLLDEVQHLATDEKFRPFTAALRSFMVNRSDNKVKGIFTGSSQHGLSRLFNDTKAPFFNSSQTLIFKELDEDFVRFELGMFKDRTGVELDFDKAFKFFVKKSRAPGMLIDLLKSMVLANINDFDEGISIFEERIEEVQGKGHREKLSELSSIDMALFRLVSMGSADGLYTVDGIAKVSLFVKDGSKVNRTTISNSLNRLKTKGMIYSPQRGKWFVEDPSFRDYLLDDQKSGM